MADEGQSPPPLTSAAHPLRTFTRLCQASCVNCHLNLQYEFDAGGDDFGQMAAHIITPTFTGRNHMWVQWQDVVEFATSLSRYPIDRNEPVIGKWGFGENGVVTEITKVIVEAAGVSGGLYIQASLANFTNL